ncbi:unnamed protein product [Hapterophycus canaliculatus]
MAWTKGDRKARRQLEKALSFDREDHVTRFALVRLLANKADPVAAEELLRGPGMEDILLSDPSSRVSMLSSLGGAYLMLWRARGETTSGNNGSGGGDGQGKDATRGDEVRLDVSSERTDLLHRAQHFLEEALMAPKNLNDPAIRAQVAFCREARGDCKEALALYASIISDSALSPGTSAVIFRTSVLLAYVGRFDECVRYLEFIEGQPPKGCSLLLIQALLFTCYVSMGLEMKASRRTETLREVFNVEYTAGRIAAGFSRDEIPWDRLPGWFDMWRELGLQSLHHGDYYAGVQMFSQATLQQEDAETMVCAGEMLWVLSDAKRALALCERAYAADPLHAGAKRRLSAWAPERWKERIAKEEERREAVTEMRRLAELSCRKSDAMLARRRRREKSRVLRAWRWLHEKRKNRRRTTQDGGREGEVGGERGRRDVTKSVLSSGGSSSSNESGSDDVSGSGSSSSSTDPSPSVSVGSSRSGGRSADGDRWSSFASSLSARQPSDRSVDEASSSSSARISHSFPVPSAIEAAEAGRENFAVCFRAKIDRTTRPTTLEEGPVGRRWEIPVNMASVEVAANAVHKAMRACGSFGGKSVSRGRLDFVTPEMRALARFEWQRKTHEAKITRVVYGS